jgi:hypothetical protein
VQPAASAVYRMHAWSANLAPMTVVSAPAPAPLVPMPATERIRAILSERDSGYIYESVTRLMQRTLDELAAQRRLPVIG